MFETLNPVAGDPLLALMLAYRADTRIDKIDLGVGVYKDEQGNTPVLQSVKAAEAWLLDNQHTKTYIGSAGAPEFGRAIEQVLFGGSSAMLRELNSSGRICSVQTPGGTGALRVAGDFIHQSLPQARIWVSSPTWGNHFNVFESAGLEVKSYPWLNRETRSLDSDGLFATLDTIPAGDVVLLHACCHNPTGLDLDDQQWHQLGSLLRERGLLPLIDTAYLGFAEGLEQDSRGIRILADYCPEMLITTSCSKNFGLYNERIGALTLIAASHRDAEAAFSLVNYSIRGNYSMPPNHGAAIVTVILDNTALRQQWLQELAAMRDRIRTMRDRLTETMASLASGQDFSFIGRQNGMFSFSGLTEQQVHRLREEDGIYIVDSGRINIAGINESNIDRLCSALARVVNESASR